MPNSMQTILAKLFIAISLLLVNSTLSIAQLYGVPVSKVENMFALSPDKQWSVSVKLNKENLPHLTIQKEPEGKTEELLGVTASGWILWSPDSKNFAFTDAAFADHYFVHLCSVMLAGTQCRDLSSEIEDRIKENLAAKTEIDKLYSKALKWHSPDTLIVGVDAVTNPEMKPRQTWAPVHEVFRAFLVNAKAGHITKELTKKQAYHELGIRLDQLEW